MPVFCCHLAEPAPLLVAWVINADKTVIPHVSAWLVGGFNEDRKYWSTASSKKKKQT